MAGSRRPALVEAELRRQAVDLLGRQRTVGHGQTEEGLKKRARNLADAKWQETVSDGRLESSIKRGHDRMPAFGRKLNDEQVKALVAEIRSLVKKGS